MNGLPGQLEGFHCIMQEMRIAGLNRVKEESTYDFGALCRGKFHCLFIWSNRFIVKLVDFYCKVY